MRDRPVSTHLAYMSVIYIYDMRCTISFLYVIYFTIHSLTHSFYTRLILAKRTITTIYRQAVVYAE